MLPKAVSLFDFKLEESRTAAQIVDELSAEVRAALSARSLSISHWATPLHWLPYWWCAAGEPRTKCQGAGCDQNEESARTNNQGLQPERHSKPCPPIASLLHKLQLRYGIKQPTSNAKKERWSMTVAAHAHVPHSMQMISTRLTACH